MKSWRMKRHTIQTRYSIAITSLLLFVSSSLYSQVTISTIRNFNFGTFYQGNSGGTIDISTSGTRTVSGDIILINSGGLVSQAIFEIDAPKNTYITITMDSEATLSNGNGNTMILRLGLTDPVSPFYTTAEPPERTIIHIAGTLTVGGPAGNPPGNYQGTFALIFNYE
jgi:hypothetical protein